jgi:hypothetical protein
MAKVKDVYAAVTTTDCLNALHGLVAARQCDARFEMRHAHSPLRQRHSAVAAWVRQIFDPTAPRRSQNSRRPLSPLPS